jgi:hypothetical protein
MKNIDSKIVTLLKEGFQYETLKKLNDSQINLLHKRIVNEQTKIEDKVRGVQTLTTGIRQANVAAKELDKTMKELGEEELNEWGSSDQNIMNQSIHKELGEPEEMPMPFSSELESAIESAVDFYWDDWEEYQTDREGLITYAKRLYFRKYFPEQFSGFVKMFEPVKDVNSNEELDEETQSTLDLDKMAGVDPNEDPNPEGNEDGPSDNMKANDGMGIFETKKKGLKIKTPITTLGMMEEKVDKNPWAICTSSLGLEGKKKEDYTKLEKRKFERCVLDVKKQDESYKRKVRQIEESLVSLVNKHIEKSITKKEILEMFKQNTKEAPVKTPVKTPTKPDRKSPYQPKHKPAPKAGDTTTAPVKTPVKTPTKPDRKSPYQPKHKPAPKADLPEFLKFDNLNIKFRDE